MKASPVDIKIDVSDNVVVRKWILVACLRSRAFWEVGAQASGGKETTDMDELYKSSETGCCPRFDPEPWDEQEIALDDRLFVKDRACAFLHIPIRFGKLMTRNMDRIKKADALEDQPFMLCDEKSLWRTDVYIAVSKDVPGAKMKRISGTFLTKVFEGPYKDARKWHK